MILLDLFSGIGGFHLGLKMAGLKFEKVYWSEVDKYASKIYRQRFPDAIELGDITKITGEEIEEKVDIICGGFPCQDISIAGKKEGIGEGTRSGLFSEIIRLASILRPEIIFIENVFNLLSGSTKHELQPYTCVCGRPHRWGRLPLHSSKEECLSSQDRYRHESKSKTFIENITKPIWGITSQDERSNREVGCSLHLGNNRGKMYISDKGDISISKIKKNSSRISNKINETKKHIKSKRPPHLDKRSKQHCISTERISERSKSKRTSDKKNDWRTCEACGRKMDNKSKRYVIESWMGRVVGSLSKIGYDCWWDTLSASALGAPHKRKRIWIVANPTMCRCDNGFNNRQTRCDKTEQIRCFF